MALKYKQVEQFMRYKLNSDEFHPGDRFYSEAELKARFGVSSATVIKAINVLVTEGLLQRQQGKGTFVANQEAGERVNVTRAADRNADGEAVVVLSVQAEHDPRILAELQTPNADHYYHILRLRKIDDVPVYVQHTYLTADYFNPRALNDPQYYQALYERIKADSDLDLFTAHMTESTEITFPMPQAAAKLLAMTDGDYPAALIKRHSFLPNGSCVEYVETYKRWDYFEVEVERH